MNQTNLASSMTVFLLSLVPVAAAVSAEQPAPSIRRPGFDPAEAMAVATPDARIEQAGPVVRVRVARSDDRPGVTFQPRSGRWDLAARPMWPRG